MSLANCLFLLFNVTTVQLAACTCCSMLLYHSLWPVRAAHVTSVGGLYPLLCHHSWLPVPVSLWYYNFLPLPTTLCHYSIACGLYLLPMSLELVSCYFTMLQYSTACTACLLLQLMASIVSICCSTYVTTAGGLYLYLSAAQNYSWWTVPTALC